MKKVAMAMRVVARGVKKPENKINKAWKLVKLVDKHMHILNWVKISTQILKKLEIKRKDEVDKRGVNDLKTRSVRILKYYFSKLHT